jgi:predicted DNA-binding transcriptional regulator AlpA
MSELDYRRDVAPDRPQGSTAPPSPNRVRSLRETAELLGISLATLRRLNKEGKGPRITSISTRRRGVTDRDREAWLEEGGAS